MFNLEFSIVQFSGRFKIAERRRRKGRDRDEDSRELRIKRKIIMGSKVEYVESSHVYATNYIRNSKAIAVLWGVFTICYAIIGIVAFITPEWIGDLEHENPGRFGLWMRCTFGATGTTFIYSIVIYVYFELWAIPCNFFTQVKNITTIESIG